MTPSWTIALTPAAWAAAPAVIPFGGRPWADVLLSFMPQIIVALAAPVALAAFVRWFPRFTLRVRLALAGGAAVVAVAVVAAVLLIGSGPAPKPPAAGDVWATFMHNASRTGCRADAAAPDAAEKVWSFRDGLARAPFAGSPAVADGCVFVGSDNQRLYCLDAATGRVVWTFQAGRELFAAPVVAAGRVYVGEGLHECTDARLHCLDAATGKPIWAFPTTSHIEFAPTLAAGRLYVGAGDDGVYCLDARDGRKIWQRPGVHVDASPAVTEKGVFFGSVYGRPAFYRLDPADGSVVWTTPAPYGVCGSGATDGRRVYFGLGNGTFAMSHARPLGAVYCLSADDGRVLWKTADVKDAVLTAVALWRGRAYFGSRDGGLYCADADTGEIHWRFDAGAPVLSSPAVADGGDADAGGRVVFGCDDAAVYCLDAITGQRLWRYDTSAEAFTTDARVIASPAIADGRVYVGSMNFFFFCLGRR